MRKAAEAEAIAAAAGAEHRASLGIDVAQRQAAYEVMLAQRQASRAKVRADHLKRRLGKCIAPHEDRTADEWAKLSSEAQRKAITRRRSYLKGIFSSHEWSMADVAHVLADLGRLDDLFNTSEVFGKHFKAVGALVERMEQEQFGISFGLYLHCDLHMTHDKILQLVQAGSQKYNKQADRYKPAPLLYNPHRKGDVINVPRIAPPRSRLEPVIRDIEKRTGVQSAEDGRLAFLSYETVVQELIAKECGMRGMPKLEYFHGGKFKLPIVLQWDGTGYGKQQFNTIAIRNPYASHSAQHLYIFGLGNCDDGRNGTTRLLGPNLPLINKMIGMKKAEGEAACIPVTVEGQTWQIAPDVLVCTDTAALRHCEHIGASGWCGCSQDVALRETPSKPETVAEMHLLLKQCHSPTCDERFNWSHNLKPGESVPRPCKWCSFGHDPKTALDEYNTLCKVETDLLSDQTKTGRRRYAEWRLNHSKSHGNIAPLQYGRPMMEHDMDDQFLDALHVSQLNLGKIPYKHALLNHASDDARELISEQLSEWKHPLDCKRKENNRVREKKWFTGEAFGTLLAGERGSPGGPMVFALLLLLVADDLQSRGVTAGGEENTAAAAAAAPAAAPAAALSRRHRFVASAAAAAADAPPPAATPPMELVHIPTNMEKQADPEDIAMLRKLYGSRAQTIINSLLAFDAYLVWYYIFKFETPPFLCPMEQREAHALKLCRAAIDMHETYERIGIRRHKSYLPHGALYKMPREVLRVGNTWSVGVSSLELQNAETKRRAASSGSRSLQSRDRGEQRVEKDGEHTRVATKGNSTTMSLSTLNSLLTCKYLRQGDGIISTPATRRAERVFGQHGSGRTKLRGLGKLESEDASYLPWQDTCIKAYIRQLAARAAAEHSAEPV